MRAALAQFTSSSPDDSSHLAQQIGAGLRAGDTVLLQGEIGAGKTHFARSLIQSLQDQPEDVPSPTFTLVQTYDTRAGALWHADLYRLTGPDEILETGLLDAMEDAICLIEWPDRLGEDMPNTALTLEFTSGPDIDSRIVTARSASPDIWQARLEALT